MDWKHLLYVTIIALLYIPMVFLGATTFFEHPDDWFVEPNNCYTRTGPSPGPDAPRETLDEYNSIQQSCAQENEHARAQWEANRETIDGKRYLFITIANLIILAVAVFAPLTSTVALGLFLGSTVSAFISTINYFDSVSKIGFSLLVLLFFIVVFFITRWTGKHGKKR